MSTPSIKCLLLLAVFAVAIEADLFFKIKECSSSGHQKNTCSVQGAAWGKVTVVKQLSDSPCTEGVSYGYESGSIWVDNGCRAKFHVFTCTTYQKKKCESQGMEFQSCSIGAKAQYIEVAEQLSSSPCTEGTFGIDGNAIWANKGCRAKFHVCY